MRADPGREALAHIDEALGRKPVKDGHALAAALGAVCAFRDAARARARASTATDPAVFDDINAVVSVVMAAQFPLGELAWDELEAARGWLAAVLRRVPA